MSKKVLLIGWDAADWQVINPLLEDGKMPALQHIVENGVSGNLSTLEPVFSPMLWTSIATGKYADKHGVLGFTEPDYSTGGIKPVGTSSRKTAAIWNILNQENIKTNVVGWWPSHPSEAINGCMVSNFFQRAPKPLGEKWPVPPGAVFPARLTETLAKLRVHPAELTQQHILPFIPNAAKIDQEKDKRLGMFAKILAEASNIHSSATWLMENTEWDFMAVYYDNIDHFCHGFMKYHPPKMQSIPQEDYDIYSGVVSAAYIYHDMMLGRMLNLTDKDTTIVLISDHGFESGSNRLAALPKEAAAPAYDHRSYGIFAAMGPGIKRDELVYGANLLDITPTLLSMYDLPIGKDMDGKPLLNIFEKHKELQYIDSWDFYIKREAIVEEDKDSAEEALKMLVELGYIEKPDEKEGKAFENASKVNEFNLARVYLNSNRPKEAIPILDRLFKEEMASKYGLRLTIAYESIQEYGKALQIIEKLEKHIKYPMQQLTALKATNLYYLNETEEALALVNQSLDEKAQTPFVAQRFSKILLNLKKNQKANQYIDQALKSFPDNSSLLYLKGMTLYNSEKYEMASECFLNSIGNQFLNPKAHFYLGESLLKLGMLEDAHRAFSICLQQKSNVKTSLQRLAEIEEKGIESTITRAELIQYHAKNKAVKEVNTNSKQQFLDSLKGTVYVVSGLPRSGTSMMMQMLSAGGANIFSDGRRPPDESNPRGYFEHEGIKTLAKNRALIAEAKGKVVKVIAPQLKFLLPHFRYKVVFMNRNIEEIITSQHKMSGKSMKDFPFKLHKYYEKQLKTIKESVLGQVHVESIHIEYKDAFKQPEEVVRELRQFLTELELDGNKMIAVIDKGLYRNQINQTKSL